MAQKGAIAMPVPKGPRQYRVYALLDPRHDPPGVCYIGCTKSSVDNRLSLHITEAAHEVNFTPKDEWIRELLREGLEPLFTLLERVKDDAWEERERYWIAKYAGPLLTNVARGGRGSPGAPRSERTKEQIGNAFRGKTLSDEHRAKLSAAKMGHEVSAEQRAKQSRALMGRTASEETKQRMRDTHARLAYKHSDEAKAKISASKRNLKLGSLPETTKDKLRAAMSSLVWITNGVARRRIPTSTPVPEGWRAGRL